MRELKKKFTYIFPGYIPESVEGLISQRVDAGHSEKDGKFSKKLPGKLLKEFL